MGDVRRRAIGAAALAIPLAADFAAYSAKEAVERYIGNQVGRAVNATKVYFSENKISAKDNKIKMPKKTLRPKSKRKYVRKAKKATKSTYRKKTTLKKQVAAIRKSLQSDQAYHTHKRVYTARVLANAGECSQTAFQVNQVSDLESSMANLRYYDPAIPGTLVTANASTGTYSRQIHFMNTYGKVVVRNNYQVPCRVKIYLVKPKADTSIACLTYYTSGITDQVIAGGASGASPDLYLNDITMVKDAYNIKVLKDVVLDAGREVFAAHSTGSFDYDPALTDTHSLAYQVKYKAFAFIVRVQGVIGHDTTNDEQDLLPSGVDVDFGYIHKISYDAGVNLNDIYINDGRDTFTNGGLVSSKPVSDNLAYSLA